MTQYRHPGLFAIAGKRSVLLNGIEIACQVDHYMVETQIAQRYKNTENVNIEAVYCFPISNFVALHSFVVKTSRGQIFGVHNEKNTSYDIYDKTLEGGDSAYNLEMESSNMLVLAVGNIAPQEEITVFINLIGHLKVTEDKAFLRVPVTLSPRHTVTTCGSEKKGVYSPSFERNVPCDFKLEALIKMQGVCALHSSSHRIVQERLNDGYRVTIDQYDANPERDFLLEFSLGRENVKCCFLGKHSNGCQSALLKIRPELNFPIEKIARKSDIIFMLDCSGLMHFLSNGPGREALELCLHSMTEGDFFNVICFGNDPIVFNSKQMEYSQKTLEFTLNKLEELPKTLGESDMFSAIRLACEIPLETDCGREIILISSGCTNDNFDILRYVSSVKEHFRFYNFVCGDNIDLLERLAELTGGELEIITNREVEQKVLRQFSRIGQPVITDLCLEGSNIELTLPNKLPPIYDGDCLTIMAKVKEIAKNPTLHLTGKACGRKFIWECEIVDLKNCEKIALLWAVTLIETLENRIYLEPQEANSCREKILTVAEQFNIITRYSSFLALEERTVNEKALYYPSFRVIPINCYKAKIHKKGSDVLENFSEQDRVCDLEGDITEFQTIKNWYKDLLRTQDACGKFCSSLDLIQKLPLPRELWEKETLNFDNDAILTALAINLLKRDPELSGAAAKAVRKAERWLSTIEGKEYILRDSEKILAGIKAIEIKD